MFGLLFYRCLFLAIRHHQAWDRELGQGEHGQEVLLPLRQADATGTIRPDIIRPYKEGRERI